MSKKNKVIFIDTITREFIKFAKIMGIFPSICYHFKERLQRYVYEGHNEEPLNYFDKNSFYEYVRQEGKYYKYLNDGLIKHVYLFTIRIVYNEYKIFKNDDELTNLFLSHLKDKGYIRYIKIVHKDG